VTRLYHEEAGDGVPILLIHPAGSTASTWGAAADQLAEIGRVISYDRRGYARSGGARVRSPSVHTADAAAILESLGAAPAVVVGTSAGAAIAVDLAVRYPDRVRAVVAHEFPWRYTRHLPGAAQLTALVKTGSYALVGRTARAAETLLRSAYAYRDGGSAWDAFPEAWRRVARENAAATLADFRSSIGVYRHRRILRPSSFRLCAATGHAALATWLASFGRSPRRCPAGERAKSKGRDTQRRSMHHRSSWSWSPRPACER